MRNAFQIGIFKILMVFIFASSVQAQRYEVNTPLVDFLKNNFDSIIIFDRWSSWNIQPSYHIVAKKDSGIYFFTYKNPYINTRGYDYPGGLTAKFLNESFLFGQITPDTNRYFLPYKIAYAERNKIWLVLTALNIWQLEELSDNKRKCYIDDGVTDTYFFITKEKTKVISFEEVASLEECGTDSQKLQHVVSISNAILRAFQ